MVSVAYLGQNWPVFAYSSLRQSWRPRDSNDIIARLTEGDFGVGLPVTQGADWNLDLTAAGTFERFYVDLRGDGLKRVPVRHWVAGARARFELSWSPTNAVGGVVGAGLAWWSHNTHFEFNGVNVASQQSVVGEMTLAVRFTLR
jgi:hypothetical protein